jgi:hypothetical protein
MLFLGANNRDYRMADIITAIEKYVRDADSCKSDCKKTIIAYFDANPQFIKEEIVVYRGQTINDAIDPYTKNTFFSVSNNVEIAEDFANGGYLFEIHLKPGVQYIAVDKILEDSNYNFEGEFLIRGGGVFTEMSRVKPKGKNYELVKVVYSTSGIGRNMRNNAAGNKRNNTRRNNTRRNNTRRNNTRRIVSKGIVRQRAINEGVSENIINNNILQLYLNSNEIFENNNGK